VKRPYIVVKGLMYYRCELESDH